MTGLDLTEQIREKLEGFEKNHGRLPSGDELQQIRVQAAADYIKSLGLPEPDEIIVIEVGACPGCADDIDWKEA